jgi:cytidylate kinase
MMDHYDMNAKRAAQIVRNEERRRTNLYRKIGKQDYDQPELYHLVLNMARINLDEATDLILRLVSPKSA